MWNPFKATLGGTAKSTTGAYSVQPSIVAADTNSTVHANAVDLDDGNYPDVVQGRDVGFTVEEWSSSDVPAYAGSDQSRELIFTPGLVQGYAFLDHDRTIQRDYGSIPGTAQLNIHHGPNTGASSFQFIEGSRAVLDSQSPGYYGPVTGNAGPDYATANAYAQAQRILATVSTDAVTVANMAAV